VFTTSPFVNECVPSRHRYQHIFLSLSKNCSLHVFKFKLCSLLYVSESRHCGVQNSE
jgi:hypothetical protein